MSGTKTWTSRPDELVFLINITNNATEMLTVKTGITRRTAATEAVINYLVNARNE